MLTWLDSSWWNYIYVNLFDWVWLIYLTGLDQFVVTLIGMLRVRSNRLQLIIASPYTYVDIYMRMVIGSGVSMGWVVQRASPSKPARNFMAWLAGPIFLTCPGFRLGSGFTINAWFGLARLNLVQANCFIFILSFLIYQ